jgi:hypothetical protein
MLFAVREEDVPGATMKRRTLTASSLRDEAASPREITGEVRRRSLRD